MVDLHLPLSIQSSLAKDIHRAQHTQPQNHRAPKTHIIQHPLPLNPPRPLEHHNRKLAHLSQKSISPNLLRNTRHHYLMPNSTDKKGDKCRHGTTDMWSGGAVDVPAEKMVHGDVPFSRELEPVGAVPPVRVEMSIGEAWMIRRS
jgi:hypothetical protein